MTCKLEMSLANEVRSATYERVSFQPCRCDVCTRSLSQRDDDSPVKYLITFVREVSKVSYTVTDIKHQESK